MRRNWLIALVVPVLSVGLSFVHLWGDVRGVRGDGELLGGAAVPQDVRQTLENKCGDCHSNKTRWPVYGRLAPGSWLMERDVHAGRAAMNFSAWSEMRPEEKISALSRIAAKVRSGEMPPGPYAFMHPDSRLNDAEQQSIVTWAKAERKRMKATNEGQARSDGQ